MDAAILLQGNWQFRVEHKGIKIYSSSIKGSDVSGFKGEAEFKVPMRKLISFFHDMTHYDRWVYQLAEMEVLEKFNSVEFVLRQVINTPWPLPKREVILRSGLEPAGDNAVAITMTGEPDYLPQNPKYYRVHHSRGMWVFQPTGHGLVHITFMMHLDPGRDVPPPVSNAGMFDVPFHTLNNMRNLLGNPSYNPPYPAEIEEYLSIVEDVPDKL
jgi:hypothetical protein